MIGLPKIGLVNRVSKFTNKASKLLRGKTKKQLSTATNTATSTAPRTATIAKRTNSNVPITNNKTKKTTRYRSINTKKLNQRPLIGKNKTKNAINTCDYTNQILKYMMLQKNL